MISKGCLVRFCYPAGSVGATSTIYLVISNPYMTNNFASDWVVDVVEPSGHQRPLLIDRLEVISKV
jgi:hypothetical protein